MRSAKTAIQFFTMHLLCELVCKPSYLTPWPARGLSREPPPRSRRLIPSSTSSFLYIVRIRRDRSIC
jgi:hypothetical protein